MSEYIKVYQSSLHKNGLLFLESPNWPYFENDPRIELVSCMLKSLPDDCDLERLIKSAKKAEDAISGNLGERLRWGPTAFVITEDSGGSRTGLTGAEVFRSKLQSFRNVARKIGRWDGDECSFKSRADVLKWLDRLINWAMEAKRAETDREERQGQFEALRGALEKNASLAKKETGAGVKGILKTLDPNVAAIINNRQMNTKEKLIELLSTDKRYKGFTNVDMGDLLNVTGQRITQILAEIDKDAKKAKKEAENRIDEKFVDDRRRPQSR